MVGDAAGAALLRPDCGWRVTPFNKVDGVGRKRFAARRIHADWRVGARASTGKPMFRSIPVRPAVVALFAAATVALTAASAGAFSQGNSGAGEGGNSTFADPDEQVNIFGYGADAQPFGSGGSVQFGAQQGQQRTTFKHFQSDGLGSAPPDPLSRPSN
jgi:hypothetical protein